MMMFKHCIMCDMFRLYVGGIPKDKTQMEIKQAMCEISEDVSDVIVYPGNNPGLLYTSNLLVCLRCIL